ncbi:MULTISPECIES: AAA family ATPase [unclassified Rhizobium]|uniref:AAA family ATPase n=1 Tax=unclassified Rhizobium TaxID=2613769 RepID=UPI0028891AD1|nr:MULTISPECIES: AAA family ATPase [unclassified Rhizobium]
MPKFRTTSRPPSLPPLAIAVARCGVRNALRPFLRRRDIAFIAALIVPEGTADYYRRAASGLLDASEYVDDFGRDKAVVFTVDVPTNDPRAVFTRVKDARQVVVVTEKRENLTEHFLAGIDLVTEVIRAVPEHFIAAAREAKVQGMTRDYAEFLSTQSFDAILLAVRPTRPLTSSVRQLKRMAARMGEAEPVKEESLRVCLEDMYGYGEAKTWGLRLAEDLKAWRAGEITWDDVDRGVLLYGPPGCGKTSYAKALAATCDIGLVSESAAKWQAQGHLGDYLKAMRSAFEQAKKKAPCLLFIDEFDSFGNRDAPTSDDHHRDYRRQVINGLLECLDPSEGREGVVVVGATNNPVVIDPALLRSGRLETLVEIPLPDNGARVAILRHHLNGHQIEGDLASFVSATRGWSGADIEKLARDIRRIVRRRNVAVTESLLLETLPQRYSLSEKELRHTAVHEAGHAIVGALMSSDILVSVGVERDVSMQGGSQVAGQAIFEPTGDIIRTASYYNGRIATLLGGIAAETVVFGHHADGAGGALSSDLAVATDVATRTERHYGLGATLSVELGKGDGGLAHLRDHDLELRRLVEARLKAQFDRAVGILSARRAELNDLVNILVTNGGATGDEVRRMLFKGSTNTASVVP